MTISIFENIIQKKVISIFENTSGKILRLRGNRKKTIGETIGAIRKTVWNIGKTYETSGKLLEKPQKPYRKPRRI